MIAIGIYKIIIGLKLFKYCKIRGKTKILTNLNIAFILDNMKRSDMIITHI